MSKEYPVSTPERPYQGIVVAHTHWDREWYATFEQYRIRLVRLIDQVLDLLEGDPRFRYFTLDGQTIVLEDYLAIRPEQEGRLRALVQSGRLLIGPWYVLPDEFLVGGEALLRNLMLGAKVGNAFGTVMGVGYLPDPFGHVAQLPQILAGFGIDSFIFSRGLGDEGEALGSEFLWQAPDGTTVLAVHQIGWDDRGTGYLNASSLGYGSPWLPRTSGPDFVLAVAQLEALSATLRRYARTPYLLFNNGCDHFEPQPELPRLLDCANAALSDLTLVQGTFPQYVDRVRAAPAVLKTWRGELRGSRYAPLLAGVFSARMHLKQENERTQTLLSHWAEPFSAIAWLEGADYPAAFLWRAWRYLLWNHPHDSISGCSIDQVHAEMLPRFAHAEQIGEHFAGASLAFIAAGSDRSWLPAGALPLAVWNPLGWPRTDVVRLTLDLPLEWSGATTFEVVAPEGPRLPCQVLGRRRHQPLQGRDAPEVEQVTLAFVADAVPALGYRIYGLRPTPTQAADTSVVGADVSVRPPRLAIENAYYKVLARPDGTLDITHKPSGHALAGAFLLSDEADAGDEYTFAPLAGDAPRTSRDGKADLRLISTGPVVSTIEVALDWPLPVALAPDRRARDAALVSCPVHLELSLYDGVDRLDLRVALENPAADHRLRLLLPTGIAAERVAAAGHFAVLERAVALPEGIGWAERPGATSHHSGFVDVGDGRCGVALIAAGLPEYEAIVDGHGLTGGQGLTLALTLLRCVGWLSRDDIAARPGHAGPGLPTPGAQCPGRQTFQCALYVHDDGWLRGRAYQRALEHNVPLRATILEAAPGGLQQLRPKLPAALSFLTVEGDGLVLSALKRSEDGRWLVARLYNAAAEAVPGRLRCYRPITEAALLRLDERELEALTPAADGTLPFDAPAGKILTFGLRISTPG